MLQMYEQEQWISKETNGTDVYKWLYDDMSSMGPQIYGSTGQAINYAFVVIYYWMDCMCFSNYVIWTCNLSSYSVLHIGKECQSEQFIVYCVMEFVF